MQYHKPYFLQTESWANFWKQANDNNHDWLWITKEYNNFSFKFLVYQYPWQFGQKFWYIPKGGILVNKNWKTIEENELKKCFEETIQKAYIKAKSLGICFIKIDIEEALADKLKISTPEKLVKLIDKNSKKSQISKKKIQYLSTITLDISPIKEVEIKQNVENVSLADLQEFWEKTKSLFWSSTNQNIRRYTKKSLNLVWEIGTKKTEENFEAFWKIYSQTKDRQKFKTQSKKYTKQLFDQDFSRIIIIKDANSNPVCVWFGIILNGTITYLYGGNTEYSFKNYGQYLMHLVAIYIANQESCDFYDLGGYDPATGYGKFKEGYRGQVRNFIGPVDIPVHNLKFQTINNIIKIVKKIKNRI